MRYLILLLLSCSIFFAFGQSARKINKELQQDYMQLFNEYNEKFDQFDSVAQLGTQENKVFITKARVVQQAYNKLMSTRSTALIRYDRLIELESTKDIAFSRGAIATYQPPSLSYRSWLWENEMDRFRLKKLERKNYLDTLRSKKIKDQNEEYQQLISRIENNTAILASFYQRVSDLRDTISYLGSHYDSTILILNNDIEVIDNQLYVLDSIYSKAEERYKKNGPKGFNTYYARYFPNAFPSPKPDGFAHADFGPVNNEVGNEDEYAPPPREEEEVFEIIDVPAEFPGGVQALRKFIQDNMIYPEVAREMGYQGKCYLKFVVSKSGTISNVVVKKGVPDCPECDKEAIRIIRLSPKWKPAENSGVPVNSYYTVPISFKL